MINLESDELVQMPEGQWFPLRQVPNELARFYGSKPALNTVKSWIARLCIEVDPEVKGVDRDGFKLLARLAVWRRRSGTIDGFLAINNIQPKEANTQNDNHDRQQQERQASTAGVSVTFG